MSESLSLALTGQLCRSDIVWHFRSGSKQIVLLDSIPRLERKDTQSDAIGGGLGKAAQFTILANKKIRLPCDYI